MHSIIIISAILASAVAAPGYHLLAEESHVYHAVPLTSKSTLTQSSQVVDHGSTFVHTPVVHTAVHAPVVHTAIYPVSSSKTTITKSDQVVNHGGSAVLHPVHSYGVMPYHSVYHVPSKTTVTKSNQVVNHGGTTVVHAPVVPVVHAPVVHHTPVVYHSSPLVAVKTGDSAITHHSSTVHETVPVFTVHH